MPSRKRELPGSVWYRVRSRAGIWAIDGQPWWRSPLTPKESSQTLTALVGQERA